MWNRKCVLNNGSHLPTSQKWRQRRKWTLRSNTKTWDCFVVLLITGVWLWHKNSSHSLLLTLSLIIWATAFCARQPAIWTGDAMPTHSLTVKDIPLGTRYPSSHLVFKDLDKKTTGLEDSQGAIIWHFWVSSGLSARIRWHLARKLARTREIYHC